MERILLDGIDYEVVNIDPGDVLLHTTSNADVFYLHHPANGCPDECKDVDNLIAVFYVIQYLQANGIPPYQEAIVMRRAGETVSTYMPRWKNDKRKSNPYGLVLDEPVVSDVFFRLRKLNLLLA